MSMTLRERAETLLGAGMAGTVLPDQRPRGKWAHEGKCGHSHTGKGIPPYIKRVMREAPILNTPKVARRHGVSNSTIQKAVHQAIDRGWMLRTNCPKQGGHNGTTLAHYDLTETGKQVLEKAK